MTRRKRQRTVRPRSDRTAPRLSKQIRAALTLLEEGDPLAARQQLLTLADRNPRSISVLRALLDVCAEIEDWYTFAYYSEELAALETGPRRAETLRNLVFALTEQARPILALYYAREIVDNYPDSPHAGPAKDLVEASEPLLTELVALEVVAASTPEEALALLVLQERLSLYTDVGHPEKAIPAAEALLAKRPNHIPAQNNLSLAQFTNDDSQAAIATAHQVLGQEPDNYHALSNLVRYYTLTAQFDLAREMAGRLEQLAGDIPDLSIKQVEAFAYLGDDEAVLAVYRRANKLSTDDNSILLHLAAVASLRQGNQREAWRLWRAARKMGGPLSLAESCLAERNFSLGQRNIPWYWPFANWFPGNFGRTLERYMGPVDQGARTEEMKQGARTLLADRPYLPDLFAHILPLGDETARAFVLGFIELANTPDLARIAYDFAVGPYGSDDQRMSALRFVSQEHPELLPDSRQVRMWINGQQRDLGLLGYDVYFEPELPPDVPRKFLKKHEKAHDLLLDGQPDRAEPLLKELISERPDFPSAYNQLAVAYELQGRTEEARALVKETHARFPDYLFARVSLARMLAFEQRYAEARELLEPVLSLSRLHITEFRALAKASMDLDLAQGRPESAQRWLELWQQVDPDDPDLLTWRMHVEGPERLLKKLRNLSRQKGKGRSD